MADDRLLPEHQSDPRRAAGLARWWWAWDVARQMEARHILVCGPGIGPGCQILAHPAGGPARAITALAMDARSLEKLETDWPVSGVHRRLLFRPGHQVMDKAFTRLLGTPDLIVGFDFWDHLPYRDLHLLSLSCLLEPDGRMLTSASGAGRTAIGDYGCRLCPATLRAILNRYFRHVRVPDDPGFPANKTVHRYVRGLGPEARDVRPWFQKLLLACEGPLRGPGE